MQVQDVMTRRVRTLLPDDSLDFARSLFVWTGIRHAPVVENGELIGVLTDRDLAWYIAREKVSDPTRVPVAEAMRREVLTAGPEDSLTEAAARMAEHKIGCLPITRQGKVIGIVTTTDVLAGEVRSTTMPSAGGPTIADVMTDDPVTVHKDDLLIDAAAKMQQHRIRHLPVVDVDGRAVGMLSDRDLRQVVGDLRRTTLDPDRQIVSYRVEDAMSAPVISVTANTSLVAAAEKFADFEISAVAVVSAGDQLIGIASYIDMLQGLAKAAR